jgi:hypothetical protein
MYPPLIQASLTLVLEHFTFKLHIKMNIQTINGGFTFNETPYTITSPAEPVTSTQVHIPTNDGTILLDLSCTINSKSYDDLTEFIQDLYKEIVY